MADGIWHMAYGLWLIALVTSLANVQAVKAQLGGKMLVDLTLQTDLLCTAILVPLQFGEGQRRLLDPSAWQGEVLRVDYADITSLYGQHKPSESDP
jgi:hypothetical protein